MIIKGDFVGQFLFVSLYISPAILKRFTYVAPLLQSFASAKYYVVYFRKMSRSKGFIIFGPKDNDV